jgi:hypothetical protein
MMWSIVAQGPTPLPPPPPGVDVSYLIGELFPMVMAVAGLIVGGVVLYAFLKSDIASAISERIRARLHRHKAIDGAGDEPRVAQLEERVDQLHGQIGELAERLDFAERLLAQKRERTLRAGE